MNINPFDILKNMNTVKEQFGKLQEEMQNMTASGSSGGGIVKVSVNGRFEIVSVELSEIAVDPRDIPMLQDLIVAACHDAYSRMQALLSERLGPLASDMGILGGGAQ